MTVRDKYLHNVDLRVTEGFQRVHLFITAIHQVCTVISTDSLHTHTHSLKLIYPPSFLITQN